MPLKTAVATKARRHAPSAAASSELAGCCCAGARAEFIKTAYHCYGRETTLGCKRPAVSHPGSSRGLFLPLNATIIDLIYPDIPGLHEIWAASRLLVNHQPVKPCVSPRASGHACRSDATANRLQSKDLFLNLGGNKNGLFSHFQDGEAASRRSELCARPAAAASMRFRSALKIRNGSRARARC